ncbi:MAG: hypothetical protein KTR20_00830 [Cellvibrionaceae bacterium]|nr:hypothetical protein [Cellvibrionaceae bacterium]
MRYLVVAVGCFLSWSGRLCSLEMDGLSSETIYLSPIRLKQSPHNIPVSVANITQETIAALQINTLADLMKYVAGQIPQRMHILLDGVSLYRSSYAAVNWAALPISIHDVAQVEITRSPSAASYDVHSTMAIINIRTKDPYDVGTAALSKRKGSHNLQMHDLQHGGDLGDNMRYRLSLSTAQDGGDAEHGAGKTRRDGRKSLRVNGKLVYDLAAHTQADIFLGYSDALAQLEVSDTGQLTPVDIMTKSLFTRAEIKHDFSRTHSLKLNMDYTNISQTVDWQTCYPAIMFSSNLRRLYQQNPNYTHALLNQQIPTGGAAADDALSDAVLLEIATLGTAAFQPLCNEIHENRTEKKHVVELQDTLMLNHNLRVVTGLGMVHHTVASETFLNDESSMDVYRLFSHGEYRFSDIVVNAGLMLEDHDLVNRTMISSRMGINYRLNAHKTLRFLLAKTLHVPDLFEQGVDWHDVVHNLNPPYTNNPNAPEVEETYFFANVQNDSNIEPEQVITQELSLYSNHRTRWSRGSVQQVYDLKLFHNRFSHLASEKLPFNDVNPNDPSPVTVRGLAINGNLSVDGVIPSQRLTRLDLHIHYAYIDDKTDGFYGKNRHARHSGAAYGLAHFHDGWRASLAYYRNSGIYGESFDGWEAGLGKHTGLGRGEMAINGKLVYWPNAQSSLTHSAHAAPIKNIHASKTAVYLTVNYMLK